MDSQITAEHSWYICCFKIF